MRELHQRGATFRMSMSAESRVDWKHVADRLAVALNNILECQEYRRCRLCVEGEKQLREVMEREYFPAQATQEDIDAACEDES